MKINKKAILFGVLSILWMLVIFYFSGQSADESNVSSDFLGNLVAKLLPFEGVKDNMDMVTFIIRKGAHMTEYAILGVFYYMFFTSIGHLNKWYISPLLAGIYAITDEFHQNFSDGRSPQVTDVCIDTCGALLGVLVLMLIIKLARKRKYR